MVKTEKTEFKELTKDFGNILMRNLGSIAYSITSKKKGIFSFLIGSFIGIYLLETLAIDFTIVNSILNRESIFLNFYLSLVSLIIVCTFPIQMFLVVFIKKRVIAVEKMLIYCTFTLLIVLEPVVLVCSLVLLALAYVIQRKRAQNKFKESIDKLDESASPCEKNYMFQQRAISVSTKYGVPVSYVVREEHSGIAQLKLGESKCLK